MAIRSFLAPNPGPFTFGGTRSYVVGGCESGPGKADDDAGTVGGSGAKSAGRTAGKAVVDPGPAGDAHLRELARAAEGSDSVVVLLTHAHADHAAGAFALARLLGAEVAGPGGSRELRDGEEFETDAGPLVAIATPGHARQHFCFHLRATDAVFTGDLVLGCGDTTWVGEYPGAVADYLKSLDRLEALRPRTLHPGHGESLSEPTEAIARFRRHRLQRIAQVRRALAAGVGRTPEALAAHVYGWLSDELFGMAVRSVQGALDYLSDAE